MPVNIEIKARCRDPEKVREVLLASGARHVGLDHQVDTYFRVRDGRLKLRQGSIENSLIFYSRTDGPSPKRSDVILCGLEERSTSESLRQLLDKALGVRCVVDKRREIFFHGDVKFHVDDIDRLGSFVEIEVIERGTDVNEEAMLTLCQDWMASLGIRDDDLIAHSYADMMGSED